MHVHQAVAAKISAARALAQRLAEENSAALAEARASADGSTLNPGEMQELSQCALLSGQGPPRNVP